MPRVFLMLLLLGVATMAWAAELSMVQGVVKLADGTPCPNITVTLLAGGQTYTVTTDARGHFGKSVPAGDVRITAEGKTLTLTAVTDDWEKNQVTLTLGGAAGETTQVVFGTDGKPVPNADLYASYAWKRKSVIVRARANAKGVVVWKDLPPVPVIVWGSQVPAGVLPVGAVNVTAPLPPPTPQPKEYCIAFTLPPVPGPVQPLYWMVDPPGSNGIVLSHAATQPDRDIRSNYNQFHLVGGTRFSMVAWALSTPPRIAVLRDVYAPYTDEVIDDWPLDWGNGANVTLKLTDVAGAPVAGLQGLRVLPGRFETLPPCFMQQAQQESAMLRVTRDTAGNLVVAVPAPGTLRLAGDLYDETSGLDIPVAATDAGKTLAVQLPKPLLTAAGGTEVSYVSRVAPLLVRKVQLDASTPQSALYGPADLLAACWYRPSPDRLTCTNFLTGGPAQSFSLRTVYLRLQDAQGKPYQPYSDYYRQPALTPLLPGGGDRAGNFERPLSEMLVTYPDGAARQRVTAWPGSYTLEFGTERLASVTIPPDGPAEIPVTTAPRVATLDTARQYAIKWPGVDHAIQQYGTFALLRTNEPADPLQRIPQGRLRQENGIYNISVNLKATAVSCTWLGVGMIDHAPLPPAGQKDVALPAWTPGLTLRGVIKGADGTPLAKGSFSLTQGAGNEECTLYFTTDDAGGFSIPGLEPGICLITQQNTANWGGWCLRVPADGLPPVTLQTVGRCGLTEVTYSENRAEMVWWVPAQGMPVRLPLERGSVCTFDTLTGPGQLWIVDTFGGGGRQVPFAPELGVQRGQMGEMLRYDRGPSLAIYFPPDPQAQPTGRLTLTGKDNRAGLRVVYTNVRFQTPSLLGKCCAQLTALPTGAYHLQVETTRGPVETDATVTERGGVVKLTYP